MPSRDDTVDGNDVSTPDSQFVQSAGEDDDSRNDSKKRNSKSSKPRLTATQKNTNHKDAENKRRSAIRNCFCELCMTVPGAHGQERSEQVVLTKTAEFLMASTNECREIVAALDEQGTHFDEELRPRDNEYGGAQWREPNLAKYERNKVKKAAKGTAPQDYADADGEAEDEV